MATVGVEKDKFGVTSQGEPVDRYTLRNAHGLVARIMTFGATVTELHVPDRAGRCADVVLGFDALAPYEARGPYFGCVVGRVAFRIAEGTFQLGGTSYQLTRNAGRHHLHGGIRGFSHVVWKAEPVSCSQGPAVAFTHFSPDGDQGYPGNLQATAVFTLTDRDELKIEFKATADQPTPVNLAHHGYFNLRGAGEGDVLDHRLQIDAEWYNRTDEDMTPTGELARVAGTPFDFRQPTPIGARIRDAGGYDLSYLHRHQGGGLARVAAVWEPLSGRAMEVSTTAPGIVLYTGNYLDGTLRGKEGKSYPQFAGLCLETGGLPDAVHHPGFPSVILLPGQTYRHTCVYRFFSLPD